MSIRKLRLFYICMIAFCACLVYAVSSGIRSNLALLLNPIMLNSGVTYTEISFVIALGQLVYGLVQPLFAYLALKKSYGFMLTLSCILMFVGLFATPFCTNVTSLTLFLGILFHAGTGGTCFGLMMAVATPALGLARATAVSGFVNAGTGVGSMFLCPFMNVLNSNFGIQTTMMTLSGLTLIIIPVSLWLSNRKQVISTASDNDMGIDRNSFLSALHDRTFIIMLLSFATCGFHMSILQTHLYSQFISYGITDNIATLSYSLIGISTMIGAVLCGFCYRVFSLKNVLGTVYMLRAVAALAFIFLMPKTVLSVILFSLCVGLTCDATVSPTSEIIRNRYGIKMLGILFGCAFIFHQLGSFVSSNVAGLIVDKTQSYDLLWSIDIILCLLASLSVYALGREKTHHRTTKTFAGTVSTANT
ncbi:MFS transporter [Succinivibrio dextrinosolvens]|uniref:MFS transporter n=1 Tax=Succinivibrio dextrinosolvens TaxID=83771 RepID=UPI00068E5CCA|nr:MFS transporter [Succinivibrio dextrinosolvens]